MEDYKYNNFSVQFGEDPNSDLNKILNETIINFSLSHIDFKIGILDKKLQPFSILNNLIRVKKINLYLNVLDEEKNIVGTFKIEDCNFLRIEKYNHFLNGFSYETSLKSEIYESRNIRVVIDIETIYFEELVLYKKESKKISDLESLKIEELGVIKKKSSGLDYDRGERVAYINDPAVDVYVNERPMREETVQYIQG